LFDQKNKKMKEIIFDSLEKNNFNEIIIYSFEKRYNLKNIKILTDGITNKCKKIIY
jgi:hypothetical protein